MEDVAIKTVLITGGLGCLGGGLGKYLMNAGYQVVIGSSRQDAELPNELKNCSLVYTDFDNVNTLSNACREVDCVIHLATINSQQSQNDPKLAMEVHKELIDIINGRFVNITGTNIPRYHWKLIS